MGWIWLEVEGPLPFSLVGVLAGLTVPLAEDGIGVFTIATHETDHLLIRADQEPAAQAALIGAGHVIDTSD